MGVTIVREEGKVIAKQLGGIYYRFGISSTESEELIAEVHSICVANGCEQCSIGRGVGYGFVTERGEIRSTSSKPADQSNCFLPGYSASTERSG